MERVMGIEPTSSAWEAEVLPLNNTREALPSNYTHPDPTLFDYHSAADVAQQPVGISTIGTDPGAIFRSCFRSAGEPGLLGVRLLSPRIDHSTFHKPVRSYVRREGRMTRAQHRALEVLWPKYGIGEDTSLLTAIGIFGDQRPLTLEIGFGNGQNLVDLALANPNHGYIGVDVYRPGAGRLMLALDRLEIGNVRILLQDATEVLLHRFAERSLDNVLIYFPDPWPKKRHHKRRIVRPDFLHNLALCLKLKGFLHIATDCNHYGQAILDFISLEPLLTNSAPLDKGVAPLNRRSLTKYEAQGIERGHPIVEISARRT